MLATVVDCQQIHHMILNVILRAAYVHGVRGKKFFIYNLSRSQGTPVTAAIFFRSHCENWHNISIYGFILQLAVSYE